MWSQSDYRMLTLTHNDVVRQVIKRLDIDMPTKISWLRRRAIKRGRVYTMREFRMLRRRIVKVINDSVVELNDFIKSSDLSRAEEDYQNRIGQAPIDIVVSKVIQRLPYDTFPPPLVRSCTGFYGCKTTEEDVYFASWE